ncbi:L-2-hydroxyglutarate oxidase [Thermodesulfobacterium sp. TA1]|uniref:L-2-hydroxyglutarate oxidase n=1 Tax=Thermodesulfobacterium sp. TA1 TaxID=2234087 RepID=UPI00123205C1|nr:L-2-hydroxyglutarate oxidase [Thermodesulfobacterium sp. TA1]QER42324.1 L-2-hydroxyglutarate oxidase [Thermodesulfobacterium sp. TA1]
MKKVKADFLIIGAGIIGLALGLKLKERFPEKEVYIIEKEKELGFHSSGRNSGVLHAGFYYYPDSLKAKFTKKGNEELTRYCEVKGLGIRKCGKVVVAKSEEDLPTLYELKRRGEANGVEVYLIDEKELKDLEPNAKTFQKALWSPTTSTVDPIEVLNALKKDLETMGVKFFFNTPYQKRLGENEIFAGKILFSAEKIINASGLYADKIAKDFGFGKDYVILPFKGLYLEYTGTSQFISRNIYPVPNLKNPFLGVHFTIKIDGTIKIGPTATPCLSRENYGLFSNFKLNEMTEIGKYLFLLFFKNSKFRSLALDELKKYWKSYLISEAQKLVYYMDQRGFNRWGKPGIRAQLLHKDTLELVQDFVVEGDQHSLHILNAVSPAFTACLPFAEYVVTRFL